MKMIKKIVFEILKLLLLITVGVLSLYAFVIMYIAPIIDHADIIYIDETYVLSFVLGTATLFCSVLVLLPFWWAYISFASSKMKLISGSISLKMFYNILIVSSIVGGGGAFISNFVLLNEIIPKGGYFICPKKNGYKENLLRDYVLDVSLCEVK